MALFVDGPVATVSTLTEYDSNVLAVAAGEGINLTTKLLLAYDSILVELERLLRQSESWSSQMMLSQINSIENVIWTKALRVWHVAETLSLIYRDAYYSQLNDRHQARAEEYAVLANRARRDLVEAGLDMVRSPLQRPVQPIVSQVPALEAGGTFYFAVTHRNDAGHESEASPILSVEVTDGNAADLILASALPANATSWNLYAGTAPDQIFRQNESPLPLDTDWCYLPSLAVTAGIRPSAGQPADQHWSLHRYMHRG